MSDPHFDVFLSHHSRDKPVVERIAVRLKRDGIEPWLDTWCLTPGGNWQTELEAGLRASRAFAIFVGPHGVGNWARMELDVGIDRAVKDRAFRVFLVLLPALPEPFDPTTLPAFLNMRTWVDLRAGFDEAGQLQPLINAISGIPLGPSRPIVPNDDVSPYLGLHAFDEAQAEFFFGREADVQRLLEKLKASRFLAVVGPSGSGKSSLARAGLIPALRRGGLPSSQDWPIRVFTPGARPLDELAAQLKKLDPDRPMGRTLDELRDDPRTLDLVTTLTLQGQPPDTRLVLVVDQFEEVFTLCRDEAERERFLDNLLGAATVPNGRCLVVLTLRADFYPRCAAYPELAALLAAHQFLVGPLDEAGLRDAVVLPAERVGLEFEPGLVDTIMHDVRSEPGALPLLEHALLELWQRRRGRLLTLGGYRESGGVTGAIAKRADAEFAALDPAAQAVARRVLLRLTQPGEETEDTRRRAELDELVTRPDERPAVEAVVNALVAARLLTASHEEPTGTPQVDVAHEALIRAWPRLRGWIEEDREGLRTHRRLTEAAQEWEHRGRDPDMLYRGARLAEAQALATRTPEAINDRERAFLTASVELREQELAAAEAARVARERQRRRIVIGLAAFSLIALILAGFALWQRNEAVANASRADEQTELANEQTVLASERADAALAAQQTAEAEAQRADEQSQRAEQETDRAEQAAIAADEARQAAEAERDLSLSRQLAAQSSNSDDMPLDLRLLLGLESIALNPDGADTRGSLAAALDSNPRIRTLLHGHTDSVSDVAFHPDGTLLASASADGTVRLWDGARGQQVGKPLIGHEGLVGPIAFSVDGSLLASGGSDGTVRLWDVVTQSPVGPVLSGHEDSVTDVVFDPRGHRLVSTGFDDTVRFWNLTEPSQDGDPVEAGQDGVTALAFNSSGLRFATTGVDGTVRVWETDDSPGAPLVAHIGRVNTIAFSPDDRFLATAGDDTSIRMLDLTTSTGRALFGHEHAIYHVDFSPDGRFLASTGVDNTIRIWDAAKQWTTITTLRGHQGGLTSVDFSPDGATLASAGSSQSIILWDVSAPDRLVQPGPGHGFGAVVTGVAVSPTGDLFASTGADGTVKLWDLATRQPVGDPLGSHQNWSYSPAFSSDGRLLATSGGDGTIQIWDVASRSADRRAIQAHRGVVFRVAFSPDDRLLASAGSRDGLVRLWDLERRTQVGPPIEAHAGGAYAVAFSPDGRILATGGYGGVRFWDVESRQLLGGDTSGGGLSVQDIAFHPSGDFLVTVGAGGARNWQVSTFEPLGDPVDLHQGFATSVAYSADGRLLATTGQSGSLSIFSVEEQRFLPQRNAHVGQGWSVAFSPDGSLLLSSGSDGTIRTWDPAIGASIGRALTGYQNSVSDLTFSADGQMLVTGGADGNVRFWDATARSPLPPSLSTTGGIVYGLDLSPDDQLIATASEDGAIRLWDATDRTLIGDPISAHDGFALKVEFSPDGLLLASTGGDGLLRLWDVATRSPVGDPLSVDTDSGAAAQLVAFSPDGRLLASSYSNGTVVIWDVVSRSRVAGPVVVATNGVTSLAFSPDGRVVASGHVDGTIHLLDMVEPTAVHAPIIGHAHQVWDLAFHPDADVLVSAAADGTIRFWDPIQAAPMGPPLPTHNRVAQSVAFSPDGKLLASGGADGDIFIRPGDPDDWAARACAIANRNLTREEWAQYLGNREYHTTCDEHPAPPVAAVATPGALATPAASPVAASPAAGQAATPVTMAGGTPIASRSAVPA